jgi:chemotaxis protein methyltransferase CheR
MESSALSALPSLEPRDFDWLAEAVRRETGVALDRSRLTLAEARLMPLIRQQGLESYAPLLKLARSAEGAVLLRQMIESLLTGETLFFRDLHPFQALRQRVLPELLQRRARQRRLRLWSAAASTGQEAYSLAMLLEDDFGGLAGWQVEILATDYSRAALERARTGLYSPLEINRGLPAQSLNKHFHPEGGQWRVNPSLAACLSFECLDLTRPWPPREPFDVIFLRNVLIYFDPATKRKVLQRAARALAPDGLLFLGSAESPLNLAPELRRSGLPQECCYERCA